MKGESFTIQGVDIRPGKLRKCHETFKNGQEQARIVNGHLKRSYFEITFTLRKRKNHMYFIITLFQIRTQIYYTIRLTWYEV